VSISTLPLRHVQPQCRSLFVDMVLFSPSNRDFPEPEAKSIAREVEEAMQDHVKPLLDQLKAAPSYESRLGYV
jgi:hypothetical protein